MKAVSHVLNTRKRETVGEKCRSGNYGLSKDFQSLNRHDVKMKSQQEESSD